jgi:type I restriction enzyme R subunit
MIGNAPELFARTNVAAALAEAGWLVLDRDQMNLAAGPGVAVREFPTDAGRCDHLLFLEGKPAGLIEAKREGQVLTELARTEPDALVVDVEDLKREVDLG